MVKKNASKKMSGTSYATEMGGKWFNPLAGPQVVKGEYSRSFTTASKFRNTREGSDCFNKKEKNNYEIVASDGQRIVFGEGGGPLQALLDDMRVGDLIEVHFSHLEREDGEKVPTSIKDRKALDKWKGGKKVRVFPRFTMLHNYTRKPGRK